MRYFELRQGEQIRHPIKMVWAGKSPFTYNPSKQEFHEFPDILVGYYEYKEEVEMPEVLEGDTYFVGEGVKHVLSMYDETIPFKAVQIYPFGMVEKVVPTYFSFFPTEIPCLHPSAVILPNGELQELILDGNRIPDADIFKVGGIRLHRIIVTLPVAESLLRRSLFGIRLREVTVKV